MLQEKVEELRELLRQMGGALVCFSGGVDSSYLLAEAVGVLGSDAVALTAVSPSLAPEEGGEAERLASVLGARHILVETHELDDPRYAANPVNRCYFCKSEVYGKAVEIASQEGIPYVLDGTNKDDRGDMRPGRKAARELGVRSPLDELGFTKPEIRHSARELELPVWDKPALACLSSRFPFGVEITPERLTQVARCESVLRQLGFRVFRVRYHEAVARIEVGSDEIGRVLSAEVRETIDGRFRQEGFSYVAVDLRGYRSGALNSAKARLVRRIGSREVPSN